MNIYLKTYKYEYILINPIDVVFSDWNFKNSNSSNRYRDPKPALYEPKTIIKEKATFGQSLGLVVNYNRLSTPDKGTTLIAEASTLTFCKWGLKWTVLLFWISLKSETSW